MKVRLMIIIGVISFLLGGCNKIQKKFKSSTISSKN